jgi:hypothetical protein
MSGKKRWIGRPLERTQGLRRTPARKGCFTDGLFVTLTTTTTALTRSVPQVCHQAKRQQKTLPQWSIDRCPKSKRSKMGPALCEGIHSSRCFFSSLWKRAEDSTMQNGTIIAIRSCYCDAILIIIDMRDGIFSF